MLASIFILFASRTLIARFVAPYDRMNAVLLLPVIAPGVPGGLVSRFDTCFHACFDSCVDTRFEPCF
jgi:hypothetical protein